MSTASHRKPKVFIGSSREAMNYANAVCSQLEYTCQVSPWYAGVFKANDYTMEALERELAVNDFGVFVFAADDVAMIRQKPFFITRDNTIFEMGLFWGRLGRKRVFCIVPRDVPPRDDLIDGTTVTNFNLPSDLQGLTLMRYPHRDDDNYEAAVTTACAEIGKIIQRKGLFTHPEEKLNQHQAMMERKQKILRFFWDYIRNVNLAEDTQRYPALAEAIRNSFMSPAGFITTGAAIWKKDDEHIIQVGGNVGRGRAYSLKENDNKSADEQKIAVVEAFLTGNFSFYRTLIIDHTYILCYPLGKEHVLSVHISGNSTLHQEDFGEIIGNNEELLSTLSGLIGGDSK